MHFNSASGGGGGVGQSITRHHRRRINTEENVKVVVAVWGTTFIQLLAALAILHKDDFESKDKFILFFKSS